MQKFTRENGENVEIYEEAKTQKNYNPSFITEFKYLSIRNFQMTFRDPKTLGALFGQSLFISLFGGLLFWRLTEDYHNSSVPLPAPLNLNYTAYMNRVGSLFFIL